MRLRLLQSSLKHGVDHVVFEALGVALQPRGPQQVEFLLFGCGLPRPEVVEFVAVGAVAVGADVEGVVAYAVLLGPNFLE